MSTSENPSNVVRFAELNERKPFRFALNLDNDALAILANDLDILAVKKCRFEGELKATRRFEWTLTASLGATVVQPCVLTLDPVTTRIDVDVQRRFIPAERLVTDQVDEDGAYEMISDETLEELPESLDLNIVLQEALALELPAYPKSEGAILQETQFSEPGVAAMTDDDAKPFAALAALKDQLKKDPQ